MTHLLTPARVALLVVASMIVALIPRPALADPVDGNHGDPAEFHVGGIGFHGATGYRCDGAMWWVTATNQTLWITINCANGALQQGRDVEIRVSDSDGGCSGTRLIGNIDEADEREYEGPVFVGTDCGIVTELCRRHRSYSLVPGGSTSWSAWTCDAVAVGSPPGPPDSDNAPGPGADTCPRGKPMIPWVTSIHPEAVSGGWAWVSDGVLRIADHILPVDLSSAAGTTPHLYGGKAMFLFGYVRTTGASYAQGLRITASKGYGAQQLGSASDTVQGIAAGLDRQTASFDFLSNTLTWRVVGPTLTTAFGSGAPNWAYTRIGYYVDPSANAVTSSGPASSTLTAAGYTASGGTNVAGTHYPAQCFLTWGLQGLGPTNAGAIPYQTPTEVTPPPYEGPSTPPVVHIGPDCPPEATLCVDETPDDSTTLPDPDGPECAEFSISDPTTWGGELVCAMVELFSILYGLVGATNQLLELLIATVEDLFVPPAGMWSDLWSDFENGWSSSNFDDWTGALGALVPEGDDSASCEGPAFGPVTLLEDAPGGDVNVPEIHPFDACDDRETAAVMVRNVATVGIALGGAWRIWDIVAGSLGAYRGGGRHMSEQDWV